MSGRTLRRIPVLAYARYIFGSSDSLTAILEYSSRQDDKDRIAAGDVERIEHDDEEEDDDNQNEAKSEEYDDRESIETWLEAMIETVKAENEQLARVEQGEGQNM